MTLHPGTSRLVGPPVLLVLRILFAIAYLVVLGIALFFIIISNFGIILLLQPITWYSALAFVAFTLLSMCAKNRQTDPPRYARTANVLLFSATTLFLAGIPIEATKLSNALYFQTWYSASGLTLIPPVADILLGSNLEYFYKDVWIPLLVYAIWNAANWAIFSRHIAQEIRGPNVGVPFYVGAVFTAIAIHIAAAALVVLLTKVYRKVGKR